MNNNSSGFLFNLILLSLISSGEYAVKETSRYQEEEIKKPEPRTDEKSGHSDEFQKIFSTGEPPSGPSLFDLSMDNKYYGAFGRRPISFEENHEFDWKIKESKGWQKDNTDLQEEQITDKKIPRNEETLEKDYNYSNNEKQLDLLTQENLIEEKSEESFVIKVEEKTVPIANVVINEGIPIEDDLGKKNVKDKVKEGNSTIIWKNFPK